MTRPVTVYRWDDAGAPQITNRKPSEILDVLKKCLVDGYGAKAPLGWTLEYEDIGNYKAVFRNSPTDGSGGYVQCKSSDGTDTSNRSILLTPSKYMSDIDTFVHPGYIKPVGLTTGWDTWVLIGTNTGFYLIAGKSGRVVAAYNIGTRETSIFVGDFDSIIPNDAGRFIVVARPSTGGDITDITAIDNSYNITNVQDSAIVSSNNVNTCKIYDADNFSNFRNYALGTFGSGAGRGYSSIAAGSDVTKKRGLYMRPMLFIAAWTNGSISSLDRNGAFLGQSDVSPAVRGFLPGYIYEIIGRYTNETWPIVDELEGQDHFLLCSSGCIMACHWINMVEW